MKHFLIKIVCLFIPKRSLRHAIKAWFSQSSNHTDLLKIIIVDNGIERKPKLRELLGLSVSGHGKNNVIKLEIPRSPKICLGIRFSNSNNNIINIHKDVQGHFSVVCYESDNNIEIGAGTTSSGSVDIHLCGHKLIIGKDCMFASQICIWGDSHSVLDLTTKTVHNKPDTPILIGNHVWVCERVCMTKNAQIPDDTIVAMASLVTKKFTQEHTIIAGVPAKVVKTGITWDRFSPLTYEEKIRKIKL